MLALSLLRSKPRFHIAEARLRHSKAILIASYAPNSIFQLIQIFHAKPKIGVSVNKNVIPTRRKNFLLYPHLASPIPHCPINSFLSSYNSKSPTTEWDERSSKK